MGAERDLNRMRTSLGVQRWEAIGHLLSDGDYLGFNESDYRGAIAAYDKAWDLLNTPWQRQTGGADILEGIADFAVLSGDPELAKNTLDNLLPRAAQIDRISLRAACDKLAMLAAKREQDRNR